MSHPHITSTKIEPHSHLFASGNALPCKIVIKQPPHPLKGTSYKNRTCSITAGGYLGPLVSGVGVLAYGLLLQVISVCVAGENTVSASDDAPEAGMTFYLPVLQR